MAKLIALTPIGHNDKYYAEGDTFDVEDAAQVEQLLENGSAAIKGKKSRADTVAESAAAAAEAAAKADADAVAAAAAEAAAQAQQG